MKTHKLVVRWATPEDKHSIAEFLRSLMVYTGSLYGKAESEIKTLDAVLGSLDRTLHPLCNVKFVIAEVDGQSVGICGVEMSYSTWHAKPYIVINDVYVDESCRRMRVGTRILKFVTDHAHATGCCRIDLFVESANISAQWMYEQSGFTKLNQLSYSIPINPDQGVP